MKYSEIRPTLKTGDVLLFDGKSRISNAIKFFTRSRWSHVALVYRVDDDLDARGTVFCWESTTLHDLVDADTGRLTMGVQRVELSERLERYLAEGGEVAVRQLSRALTPDMVRALNAFRHEMSGRPYERNRLALLRAAYDGPGGANGEDYSSLFCSELVAGAFQRMCLLPPSIPAAEYVPGDFAGPEGVALECGYKLGSEIAIDKLD